MCRIVFEGTAKYILIMKFHLPLYLILSEILGVSPAERLVKAKSDGSLSSTATENSALMSRLKSKSLEPLTGIKPLVFTHVWVATICVSRERRRVSACRVPPPRKDPRLCPGRSLSPGNH